MRDFINPVVRDIKPSGIRRFFDIAAEMDHVISLGVGEPDFDTPEAIKLAAMAALQDNQTHYAPNQGTLSLRKAIADFETARGNRTNPENVLVTIGACNALFTALFGILNPGEEVIVPISSASHLTVKSSLSLNTA